MISRTRASFALAAAALFLPACLEADVQADVKADGSGTLGVGMKFSDKFVEIVRKMEKLDPKQGVVTQVKDGMMKKPDAALVAAWEKAGLKVLQFESVAEEKKISSSMKLEFKNLAVLKNLEQIEGKKGGSPVGLFTLTKDDKGIYTLAMGSPKQEGGQAGAIEIKEAGEDEAGEDEAGEDEAGEDEAGEDEAEEKGGKGGKGEEKEAPKDLEAEAKKAGEAMAMMGELMGEMQSFKFTVAMKVPGEVVDFQPATAAAKDGSTVTWKFDFATMMQAQMGGGENGGMDNFKVRFKMPEGQSIPESALSKPDAPKAAPGEKPAEAPKAPAPAPGGEKK